MVLEDFMKDGDARLITCCIQILRRSPFYHYFMYVDVPEYLADDLLTNEDVGVRFLREYEDPGSSYRVIYVRCRKKDTPRFLSAISRLTNKAMLCGYPDYKEFCQDFFLGWLEEEQERQEQDSAPVPEGTAPAGV